MTKECEFIENYLKRIESKVDTIEATLNGNGKPGLKIDVAMNTKFRNDMNKVIWIIVTGLIGVYIKIMFELISIVGGK